MPLKKKRRAPAPKTRDDAGPKKHDVAIVSEPLPGVQALLKAFPDWLRVDPATVKLAKIDAGDTVGPKGVKVSREEAEAIHDRNVKELAKLQYLFYAASTHSLLVVLQGMDTCGKDGTIRHVFGGLNPQGVRVRSFKAPNDRELTHDFLWRVHPHAPPRGTMIIFNRSHYEDILAVRVLNLAPEPVWQRRYHHINQFEELLADSGTVIVKILLHISNDEQKKRLEKRLADPNKNWKFSEADVAQRKHWDAYQEAFQGVLERTAVPWAPWYVVPANRKWFRNFAVGHILRQTLEGLQLQFPPPAEGLDKITIE